MISQLPADFTIVIPTYNERDRIGILLERVFDACDRDGLALEVIIVDDNSADGTGALADDWARRRRVRVIHRAGKLGLGTAVLEGFAAARTEVVGVMDGDLSHPPQLLPKLFRTIEDGFDLVVASRYVRGGGTSNFPIGRWLLSRAGCWLARSADAGPRRDVRVFPDPPVAPRRIPDVGERIQDRPRAVHAVAAAAARRGRLRVRGTDGRREQDERRRRHRLPAAAREPTATRWRSRRERPACVTVSAAQERAASASGA